MGDPDGEPLRHEPGRRHGTGGAGSAEPGHVGQVLGDSEHTRSREIRVPAHARRTFTSGGSSTWPPAPGGSEFTRYLDAGGSEPAIRRGTHGGPSRVDELRCLGNGVVPLVAAHAFRVLAARAVKA
jgi:hypothetical protein